MTVRYPVKGTPLAHQMLALQEANLKDAHAYILDAGAGKTFTCIAEAGLLYQQGEIDGMLVLAPNGPHRQWVTQELPKWADFPWRGSYNKAPAKQMRAFMESSPKLGMGVLTYNYEGTITPKGKAAIEAFIAKYPRFYLVMDESQKLKNPKAKRTIVTNELAKKASFKRILSGTPILKGLEDLFAQYYILRPGITGPYALSTVTANYYGCRNYYCQLAPIPGQRVSAHAKQIVGYRNEREFREKIRPYTTRVTADMFMKSEEPLRMSVEVEMSAKQASAYMQMKEHLLAMIDSGVVTAQNALVQMGKLQQITSGYIMDEDGKVEWISSSRTDAVMTTLEGLNEPTIVWAPFIPLKQRLYEEAQAEFGNVTLYEKPEDVDLWKKRGGIIIGNQSSGLGIGMNLQNAAANLYAANNFSSEARWQSEKRTDRIGQDKLVRYWDFVVPGTVDVKARDALVTKQEISARNIDGLREMIL